MSRSNPIVYHAWSSSASRKLRLCLAEKGFGYEGRVIDLLRFQHHSGWYKALNPGGIVPCLLVNDRALVESNLIEDLTRRIAAYLKAGAGPWLLGERLTLADIAVAPYVVRFEEERPGRMAPRAREWWSRSTSRRAWQAAGIGRYEDDTARSAREAVDDPS